jgi:hypothetical protein
MFLTYSPFNTNAVFRLSMRTRILLPCAALCFLSLALPSAFAADNPDLKQLLNGVQEISAPGLPGSLCVFGDNAFPVVAGGSGKIAREPVVAAARVGNGRVVAFGHTGYFDLKNLNADTQKLFLNAVRWSAGADDSGRVVVVKSRGLADFLKGQGIKAEDGELSKIGGARVVIVSSHDIVEKDVMPLWNFISKGGGLITASTGWGWAQLNPGKDLKIDLVANRLLLSCGIVISGGTVEKTTKDGFAATSPPELSHAARALAAVNDQLSGKTKLSETDAAQAASTLTLLAQSLPPDDKIFLPKLRALARQAANAAVPESKKPIKKEDVAARLALTLQIEMMKSLPVEQTIAHPAGAIFPGGVPADARPMPRTVAIDTKVPGWHSVGLYAAPGAQLKITLPQNAAEQKSRRPHRLPQRRTLEHRHLAARAGNHAPVRAQANGDESRERIRRTRLHRRSRQMRTRRDQRHDHRRYRRAAFRPRKNKARRMARETARAARPVGRARDRQSHSHRAVA